LIGNAGLSSSSSAKKQLGGARHETSTLSTHIILRQPASITVSSDHKQASNKTDTFDEPLLAFFRQVSSLNDSLLFRSPRTPWRFFYPCFLIDRNLGKIKKPRLLSQAK
jgi:hypothetical protein